jgi:hypothetical protein
MSQQQQNPRKPLLAGIKELIDQSLFRLHVAGEEIRHEQICECRLLVKDLDHGGFVDAHDRGVFQRRRRGGADQLPGQAGLAEKFPLSQNRDDGFFAFLGDHGKLDVAPHNIKDSIRRIPLRKENLLLPAPQNFFPAVTFVRKVLGSNNLARLRPMLTLSFVYDRSAAQGQFNGRADLSWIAADADPSRFERFHLLCRGTLTA